MPMGSPIPRPLRLVAVLVLLPFPVLLVLIWISQAGLVTALLSYAALIAAMLGGSRWLMATGPFGKARIAGEGLSGLAVLITAWAALLVPVHFGLMIVIALFFLVILADALKEEVSELPGWFTRWRAYIAAGACVTSILALIRVL